MTMATLSPATMPAPFDAVAEDYDARFTNSVIGRVQRQLVWSEMDCLFRPGQRVLEINCGTGVDALHLAAQGVRVMACDASPEMIAVARRRLELCTFRSLVVFRTLATERIGELENEGLYDGVLSNFAGLNCVADLQCVAHDLARLVRPGGKAIFCLFGRSCLWEMIWYTVQGNFKKAFRRLGGRSVKANIGPGHSVLVRYPSVDCLRRDFAPYFRPVSWKGVGIAVPPSYLEPWAERFPRLLNFVAKVDPLLGQRPGLRALADHVVVVLERVEG